MPEPIRECRGPVANWESEEESSHLVCEERNTTRTLNGSQLMCTEPEASAAALELAKATQSGIDTAAFVQAANSNAQRTAAQPVTAFHADAGATESGDSVHAGVALLKGHSPDGRSDTELMYGSVQVGAQTEAEAGLGRVSIASSDDSVRVDMEVLSADARIGIHNPDGSMGLNFGYSATLVGLSIGYRSEHVELRASSSIGEGTSFSIGTRDMDEDGKTEYCASVSTPLGTLSACVEED